MCRYSLHAVVALCLCAVLLPPAVFEQAAAHTDLPVYNGLGPGGDGS